MVRLTLLSLVAVLALPAAAQAGCYAVPAHTPTLVTREVIYADPGYRCTTHNAAVYEIRSYIQTLSATGQWHIDTGAVRHQLPLHPRNGSHRRYRDYWSCLQISFGSQHWRVKTVLYDAITDRASIRYSPASVVASGC